MTETEWLASSDPRGMLVSRIQRGTVSGRKMRLFLCGCCRLIWPLLTDERHRQAVEVGERWADDRAGPEEVAKAHARALIGLGDSPPRSGRWHAAMASVATLTGGRIQPAHALRVVDETRRASLPSRRTRLAGAQSELLRELVVDTSGPRPFDPGIATSAAVGLAWDIYDGRDFARMPILGDVLEEAGCPGGPILDHCRARAVHARGCWVVDALIGRR